MEKVCGFYTIRSVLEGLYGKELVGECAAAYEAAKRAEKFPAAESARLEGYAGLSCVDGDLPY